MQAIQQIEAANYESSTVLTEQAYRIFAQKPEVFSTEIADCLNNFGRCCMNQDDPEVAINFHLEALQIRKNFFGENHPKVAASFNNLGNCYIQIGDYQNGLMFHQKALSIRQLRVDKKPLDVATSYNNIGSAYFRMGNLQQAYRFFSGALQLREKELGGADSKTVRTKMSIGSCFLSGGNYEEAQVYFEESLAGFQQNYETSHPDIADAFYNLGNAYFGQQKYKLALFNYQNALQIRQEIYGKESLKAADVYQNIGNCFDEKGDLTQALNYFRLAKSIREEKLSSQHPDVAGSIEAVALSFQNDGAYPNALKEHRKVLAIRRANYPENHRNVALTYANLGNTFLALEQIDSALFYYQKATPVFEDNPIWKAANLNNLGICYLAKKDYKKALNYFQDALQIAGIPLVSVGLYHKNSGVALGKLEQLEEALVSFKTALELVGFQESEPLKNMDIAPDLIDVLGQRGHIYFQLFQQNQAQKYLDKALADYDLAFELMDALRFTYQEKSSRQKLLAVNFEVFNGAIKACFARYAITKDTADLALAFSISEKNKGQILLESLQESNAENFGEIPDSLLQKETNLQVNLANLEKKRLQANQIGDLTLAQTLDRDIFSLKEQQAHLLQYFESNFPNYFDLKYQTATLQITQIQKELLAPNQSLVEFFIGDTMIYIFHITAEKIEGFSIEKDFPLEDWVWQMRRGIFYYHTGSKKERVTLNETYLTTANELYQKLIAPIPNLHDRLLLIPDGALNYLPFDALLTEIPANKNRFKGHQYLIKRHQISYVYSAHLLAEMRRPVLKKATKTLAAFAPNFASNNQGLQPLKNNEAEAKMVQELFDGDVFVKENASIHQFLTKAEKYQILLLATHGKANATVGDYSFLAFTQLPEIDNNLLYVKDLYAIELAAEMVVLSACETGVGTYEAGEGVVSLARGFSFAGAKSVVTSLWAVNDKSTSELMQFYFQNIKNGQCKDVALQQAKLDYLEKCAAPHPYFWAAFIGIGNMDAIDVQEGIGWGWILLLLTSGVFMFFLLKRR